MIIEVPTNNERDPIYKYGCTFAETFRKHRRVGEHHLIFTNSLEWLLIFKNISCVVPKISGADHKSSGAEPEISGVAPKS